MLNKEKKGAYDNMGLIDHVQFGNILLERHFDRQKDPENFREFLLSTDRFEKCGLEGRLIENALFLIYADP